MFQFLKFVRIGISTLWQVWLFIRDLDRQGVEKFSDLWWWSLRYHIELHIDLLRKGEDRGWRQLIKMDNQLLRGLTILLKSERLKDIYDALDKQMGPHNLAEAEMRLLAKQAHHVLPRSGPDI